MFKNYNSSLPIYSNKSYGEVKLLKNTKVRFFDIYLTTKFFKFFSAVSLVLGTIFYFLDLPDAYSYNLPTSPIYTISIEPKFWAAIMLFIFLGVAYVVMWYRANKLRKISIKIDATNVFIKEGDLFEEDGLIAIGFNEYFDTIVDNEIIAENSLNGAFIKKILESEGGDDLDTLDLFITNNIDGMQKLEVVTRAKGKTQKYKIGTVCLYKNQYILTAFAKFNSRNEARLTMPEYLEFLIDFWDEVNTIYAARSVSVPIFGSGITRIKEHKSTTDEQLLKIMLWTFKISEMKFTHPAKLTIVVHPDKMGAINLTSIEGLSNGL